MLCTELLSLFGIKGMVKYKDWLFLSAIEIHSNNEDRLFFLQDKFKYENKNINNKQCCV